MATNSLTPRFLCSYIFKQGVPGLWANNRESTTTDGWSLDRWHQKAIGGGRGTIPFNSTITHPQTTLIMLCYVTLPMGLQMMFPCFQSCLFQSCVFHSRVFSRPDGCL